MHKTFELLNLCQLKHSSFGEFHKEVLDLFIIATRLDTFDCPQRHGEQFHLFVLYQAFCPSGGRKFVRAVLIKEINGLRQPIVYASHVLYFLRRGRPLLHTNLNVSQLSSVQRNSASIWNTASFSQKLTTSTFNGYQLIHLSLISCVVGKSDIP